MRFFIPSPTTAYYCGIDLHARSMFTHILDHDGKTVFERDLPAGPDAFLDAVKPFRQGLVVGCECMFAWYWLADLCEDHELPFVLGHALYMKAIHGGKAKNDRIDRRQDRRPAPRRHVSAGLRLSPGPSAKPAICSAAAASSSANAAQLTAHIVNTDSQYNLPPLTKKLCYAGNRSDDLAAAFPACLDAAEHPGRSAAHRRLRRTDRRGGTDRCSRRPEIDNPVTLQLLRTIPGIGKILSLVMLYEIDQVSRFPEVGNFLSYAGWCAASTNRPARRRAPAARKSATPI